MKAALIDQLNALKDTGRITGWRLIHEDRSESELTYSRMRLETDRTVHNESYRVEVTRDHASGRQGYALTRLTPSVTDWREILSSLVDLAASRNRPFAFPGQTDRAVRNDHCFDPEIARSPSAAARKLAAVWIGEAAALIREELTPGHFEAVAGLSKIAVSTSRGLEVSTAQTDVYVEGTLTNTENERFFARHASYLHGIEIRHHFMVAAEELTAFPEAILPETGSYSVLLHRNAVAQLFRAAVHDLHARSVYEGSARTNVGDCFFPKTISAFVNSARRGLGRTAIDEEGEPISEFQIVDHGVVKAIVTPRKYAALTPFPWTGGIVSLSVTGGEANYEDLVSRTFPLIEVGEFSSFTPDHDTKSFAGEVRFGYLRERDRSTPIRGGSLSGNVLNVLRDAVFSSAVGIDFGNTALGELPCSAPNFALLPIVSFAGSTVRQPDV